MFCLRVVLRRLPNNVGKLLTTIGKLLCENSAIWGPTFQRNQQAIIVFALIAQQHVVQRVGAGPDQYGHINHCPAVCTKKQK